MNIRQMFQQFNVKSDCGFVLEPDNDESISEWITNELHVFGLKPVLRPPSPSKYPSALRLLGGSHYWQYGMVWIVLSNARIQIVFVQEKPIMHMSAIEHEDYQNNLDVRNDVIHHFMQIMTKASQGIKELQNEN